MLLIPALPIASLCPSPSALDIRDHRVLVLETSAFASRLRVLLSTPRLGKTVRERREITQKASRLQEQGNSTSYIRLLHGLSDLLRDSSSSLAPFRPLKVPVPVANDLCQIDLCFIIASCPLPPPADDLASWPLTRFLWPLPAWS